MISLKHSEKKLGSILSFPRKLRLLIRNPLLPKVAHHQPQLKPAGFGANFVTENGKLGAIQATEGEKRGTAKETGLMSAFDQGHPLTKVTNVLPEIFNIFLGGHILNIFLGGHILNIFLGGQGRNDHFEHRHIFDQRGNGQFEHRHIFDQRGNGQFEHRYFFDQMTYLFLNSSQILSDVFKALAKYTKLAAEVLKNDGPLALTRIFWSWFWSFWHGRMVPDRANPVNRFLSYIKLQNRQYPPFPVDVRLQPAGFGAGSQKVDSEAALPSLDEERSGQTQTHDLAERLVDLARVRAETELVEALKVISGFGSAIQVRTLLTDGPESLGALAAGLPSQ
ncbi:MAG: hypothetical protein HY587_08625 [Candidatus Omnitrophica bacterium]|nr:hypothetical protein [Candidatus Omnitrophota bacterium]